MRASQLTQFPVPNQSLFPEPTILKTQNTSYKLVRTSGLDQDGSRLSCRKHGQNHLTSQMTKADLSISLSTGATQQ
jgi:hypothetical protein